MAAPLGLSIVSLHGKTMLKRMLDCPDRIDEILRYAQNDKSKTKDGILVGCRLSGLRFFML
jgi:hypothetical protein